MAWSKRLLPRAHITHRLSPLRNLRTPPPSARGDSSANCKAPISICRRRRSSIATRSLPHKCALVPSCGGKTSRLITDSLCTTCPVTAWSRSLVPLDADSGVRDAAVMGLSHGCAVFPIPHDTSRSGKASGPRPPDATETPCPRGGPGPGARSSGRPVPLQPRMLCCDLEPLARDLEALACDLEALAWARPA